jgi:hypothetical protein
MRNRMLVIIRILYLPKSTTSRRRGRRGEIARLERKEIGHK